MLAERGQVELTSQKKGGAFFCVTLPSGRPQRRRRQVPPGAKPPAWGVGAAAPGRGMGEAKVPFPAGDDAWVERLRDLTRSVQGGSVFLVGRQRLRPLQDAAGAAAAAAMATGGPTATAGEVGQEASGLAFKALLWALCDELLSQGYGLSASCRPELLEEQQPLTDAAAGCTDTARDVAAARRGQVDLRALWELTRQVTAHISVSPGLHVAEQAGLPHALWQPLFLVCVGSGQVRVLTLAFAGGPVVGDRPDSKRTPFVLRLATDDLVPAAALATADAGVLAMASMRYVVEPAVEGSLFMLEHVVGLEEELFGAMDSGDWAPLEAAIDNGACPPTEHFPEAPLLEVAPPRLASRSA